MRDDGPPRDEEGKRELVGIRAQHRMEVQGSLLQQVKNFKKAECDP